MRFLASTLALAAAASVHAAPIPAKVTLYEIQTPDIGSCRLKGIDTGSDNFKFYASVSAKDVDSMNAGCARCIKVTNSASKSLTAYVLDVCQGCKSGELKLSTAALTTLAIDPNLNNATATYKFTNCPTSFQSGSSVKACLMEGASNTYIPLQFYNSLKPIASANISGVAGSQQKDSFFFSSTPQVSNANGNTQWFKDVKVTLTSSDGESQSGTFAFGGTSGCATSTFQFSAASTADGVDDNGAGGSSGTGGGGGSTGVIIGAVVGGICALLIVIGSVLFIRRRRANMDFEDARHDDPAQQYLSPTTKPHAPRSPERPTYAENSMHNSTDDPSDHDGPDSPTVNFDDAATPTRNVNRADPFHAPAPVPVPPPPQQQQQYQPQYSDQKQQRAAAAAAAPKVAHQTYVTPQQFSYSKPVAERVPTSNNSSFRSNASSNAARAAPTFPAPVVPKGRAASSEDEDEARSSFDIDDLRETEELKSRERFSSLLSSDSNVVAPHSSDSAYATGHVTSPQSYVRATSLRRASSKAPERPPFRFTPSATGRSEAESSLGSSGYSDRDSYADNHANNGNNANNANTNPNANAPSSGYSRESLGILGYPYAKKPSGRNSMTEAQL